MSAIGHRRAMPRPWPLEVVRLLRWAGQAFVLVLCSGLGACALPLDNQPRNLARVPAAALTPAELGWLWPAPSGASAVEGASDGASATAVSRHDSVVALSFSGGGARAAAFALGALQGLAEFPTQGSPSGASLLDDLGFITSVSGGSLTAAWVGLHGAGPASLARFRQRALSPEHAPQQGLRGSLLNPMNLLRLAAGGLNDRSTFQHWLEQSVFDGATFSQMGGPDRPTVWINATNLQQGIPFPFTPRAFDALCSDLDSFPVAEAVAASMAVPLVFAPVVLQKHPQACPQGLPPWVDHQGLALGESMLSRGLMAALQDFRQAEHGRYVKLVDGGLTDNFGLTSIQLSRVVMGTPLAPFSEAEALALRRLLFVVVDGGSRPTVDWTRDVDGPGGVTLAMASIHAAIDTNVRLSYDGFVPMMQRWQQDIVRWRCGLSDERQAQQRALVPGWRCDDLVFKVTRLAFDDLGHPRGRALHAIGTRLDLSADQVDALVAAGRLAMSANPVVRAFAQAR